MQMQHAVTEIARQFCGIGAGIGAGIGFV